MANRTSIEWTDLSINPIIGCTKCSPGCKNCYAEKMALRLAGHNSKLGERYQSVTSLLASEEYGWDGRINVDFSCFENLPRKPARIFVGSMGDVFHETVSMDSIRELFTHIRKYPQHTFMLLTKRPKKMRGCISDSFARDFPNVWLGVTAENQEQADKRIPILLSIPAVKRFVSVEPMLGEVRIEPYIQIFGTNILKEHFEEYGWKYDGWSGGFVGPGVADPIYEPKSGIDWVVAGGESGPKARPMHPDWVQYLRKQCRNASIPFFFKQWGEWKNGSDFADDAHVVLLDGRAIHPATLKYPLSDFENADAVWMRRVGKKAAGCLIDGREWKEFPE